MDAVLVSLLLDLKTCLLIGTPILVNKFPLLYQLSPTGQCPIKPNIVRRVCKKNEYVKPCLPIKNTLPRLL